MSKRVKDDPYFNPKRAQAILFGVLLAHIGVIAVPLIYNSLTEYFDPPLVVMKVGLADLPLGDSPDAGQPSPAVEPTKTDPAPVEEFSDPTPVDPLPPEKIIEPPPQAKVDPPKQKIDPPPQTKVDPPKQKVDPPKTVQTKVDPPKPKTDQKKDPPKSTVLKPTEINVTRTTKTQAQIDAEKKAEREAEEARRKAERARQELIAGIQRDASQSGKYGTTDPGQDGILATKEMRDYYTLLTKFIYPKWTAVSPSTIELSGKISNWPVVELTIAKDGRVTNSGIVSASGNKKLDDAARALLAELKTVPVPPQAIRIPVTLNIQ